MDFQQIDFRPDPYFPDRYFEIALRAEPELPNLCHVVIERPGQEKAFLWTSGWQAGYVRIEAQTRQDGIGLSLLRLPQSLIDFLEVGYNYKISILDGEGKDLGFFAKSLDPRMLKRPPAGPPIDTGVTEAKETELPPVQPIRPTDTHPVVINMPRSTIRCTNCKGEIFSTSANCHWCEAPVGQ
jgi:hypothetical protein